TKRKTFLIKSTILSLIALPLTSCDVDSMDEESRDFSNQVERTLHDLKEAPEGGTGGGGDPEGGGGFTNIPDNPNDYDPNPDGIGDVDYPGLHPDNEPSEGEDNSPKPDNDGQPSSNPAPEPQHDFEHADD